MVRPVTGRMVTARLGERDSETLRRVIDRYRRGLPDGARLSLGQFHALVYRRGLAAVEAELPQEVAG